MEAKFQEYVPCPKCSGEGPVNCPVCHGMKTIPEGIVAFGARLGMEIVWARSPVDEAERMANEEVRRAELEREIAEHRAKYPPKPLELFSVGDWVRWRDGMPTEAPAREDNSLEALLQWTTWGLIEEMGRGPFRITRIELRLKARFGEEEHPQILFLEDGEGNRVGKLRPPREGPRIQDFGFTPVDSSGKPISSEAEGRMERFFEEGGITAMWFTKA